MKVLGFSRILGASSFALAVLAFGLVNQAKADLRLTVVDTPSIGSPTIQYYYFADNGTPFADTAKISIGNYTITDSLSSNFPGNASVGTLSQSLNITTGTGTNDTITMALDSIATPLGAVTTNPSTGLVTGGSAFLLAAPLQMFTLPSGGEGYRFQSDPSTTTNQSLVAGTLTGTSITQTPGVTTIANLPISFPTGNDVNTFVTFGSVNQYTLQNIVQLSGMVGGNNGISNVTGGISTSIVTAVPEPATVAMFATAIPFGLLYLKRRKAAKSA